MKVKSLKTAQSVKVGNEEKNFFFAPDFEIDVDPKTHLVEIINLRSKAKAITSLYNTIYFNELD